jgi:CRP-like cAMP-binding protein
VGDRIVVLRDRDPRSFLADGCAALADAANQIRLARASEAEVVTVYAEMVVAYSRVLRDDLAERGETVRLAVIDHLVERLRQAQRGEIRVSALDVVDRLHGELTREQVRV